MPEPTALYIVERQLVFSLFMALLGTFLCTPLLMMRYRRRVSVWMQKSSEESPPIAIAASDSTLYKAADTNNNQLWQRSKAAIRARGWAYGLGSASQAILFTVLFVLRYRASMTLTAAFLGLAVFLIPTLFVLSQIHLVSSWRRLFLIAFVLLLLLWLSGDGAGLLFATFNLHVLLPAVILLVFNFRFWRGTAPLVFLLAITSFSGWIVAVSIYQIAFGLEIHGFLPLVRLLGFAVGLIVGLKLLQQVALLHAKGRLSDQELTLDTWWLIYTIIQTILSTIGYENLWLGLLVLLSFGLYWGVKRLCLVRWTTPQLPPRRLLLLRVFGNSRRSERLFEQLRQAWSPIGSIELIAGSDLALRQVGPLDFLAFITGRLGDRFAGSAVAAAKRMDEPQHRLVDGSYPAYQSLCLANTWHSVMRVLAHHSDAVVMDLREFKKERQGCRIELETLAQEFPNRPVILVTDARTDLPLLYAVLAELGITQHRTSNHLWKTVTGKRQEGHTIRAVIEAIDSPL